jgi:hypothetical protein
MTHRLAWLASLGLMLLLPSTVAFADQAVTIDGVGIQTARAEDMRVFEPYIGRFRSQTHEANKTGKPFHYVVEYRWFDRQHGIVKFAVSTVFPDEGREIPGGEGFYGFDPFASTLYACGFFPNGTSGFGAVSEFDHETSRRVTLTRSMGPDGTPVTVRDEFDLVDADRWSNKTWIRRAGGDWQVMHEGTYSRVKTGS